MDMLLIVVIVILAGFGVHGYLRGMVRVLFSLVAIFLTIGLATALTPYTAQFLRTQTPLYDTVKEACTERLQGMAEEEIQKKAEEIGGDGEAKKQENPDSKDANTQEQEELTILGMKVPKELQSFLSGNATEQANELIQDSGIYEKLGDYVAEQVLQRASWLLSFVIILILLSVVVHLLDLIAKLPVLNSINHMGGLAVGLLQGLVVVWILFLVVTLCQGSEFGRQMLLSIQGNVFLKFLYDNNVIERFIMGMLS